MTIVTLRSTARIWTVALLILIVLGFSIRLFLVPDSTANQARLGGLPIEVQRSAYRTGKAALQNGDLATARREFGRLSAETSSVAQLALAALAELEFRDGHVHNSEQLFAHVLSLDDTDTSLHDRYGQILAIEGRTFDARPHLLRIIQQPQYSFEQLLIAGRPESLLNESMRPQIERWGTSASDLARRSLALGVLAWNADHFPEAEQHFTAACAADSNLIEAQARLGFQLAQRPDRPDFDQWQRNLPSQAENHPGIWIAQADALRLRGNRAGALGYYLEAIRRSPDSRIAVHQAGQLLIQLNQHQLAAPFLERARALDQFQASIEIVANDRSNLEQIIRLAKATESLGRLWESQGWYTIRVSLDPTDAAQADLARVRHQIASNKAFATSPTNPATPQLRKQYPAPAWNSQHSVNSPRGTAISQSDSATIRFTLASSNLGVDFHFYNDHDPKQSASRIQETMGGGVLVLDYDHDGWPDFHATQGCQWPPAPDRLQHLDVLYRNLGGTQFREVAALAGLSEWSYSQGGAIGDFDNDGFDDLYVGNIGPNRFFHNNGDGTFTDITLETGVAGDEWTTSCAICDINSDGLPDLYAVGYLGGDQVYTLICHDSNNIPRSCKPIVHPPAMDRLFLNLGDGRFEDVSSRVAVEKGGRGLGIIIADFTNDGKANIFISNDAEPNFYFANHTPGNGQRPQFEEQAFAAGLALNGAGQSQASMGVAAGDIDGNQLIDLLVTNYYHEGSTLYQQSDPNLFSDETRSAGLYESTFNHLGFGTQFLDADLDGQLDLVIGNGHESNYTDLGVPYEMPPQIFRNTGRGKFTEIPATEVGDYFQGKYLARGLSRLDWNRDGRPDFAVSHLDAPLALVRNDSSQTGQWLGLRLSGTKSSRDAIGARIEAKTTHGTVWQQLIAGDGYHASNDRRIVLGLGSAKTVDQLVIHWPSGETQIISDPLPADTDWVAIEGKALVQISG